MRRFSVQIKVWVYADIMGVYVGLFGVLTMIFGKILQLVQSAMLEKPKPVPTFDDLYG
jgi:hypothetical protein